jgi:hypothetical protein
MKNHQNISHIFYTYSKDNSITSSFLQVIVVFLKHLANIKSLIPIMHFVLFDFCPTLQMVWNILSPNDHSTLPWLSEKSTLYPFPSAKLSPPSYPNSSKYFDYPNPTIWHRSFPISRPWRRSWREDKELKAKQEVEEKTRRWRKNKKIQRREPKSRRWKW